MLFDIKTSTIILEFIYYYFIKQNSINYGYISFLYHNDNVSKENKELDNYMNRKSINDNLDMDKN